MSLVTLERLEYQDDGQWALRFSSRDTIAFSEVKDAIKAWGRNFARWDPTLFDARGGWLLDTDVLRDVAPRFSNLDAMLDHKSRAALYSEQAPSVRLIPFYMMLGLPVTKVASYDEIIQAYRSLSKIYHPDTGGAHQLMLALNYAYEQVKEHVS